jgi:hypothetical protein
MPQTLTIRRPDDLHLHFRDGATMRRVVPWTARQFARAIVMPNLAPPVTTTALATAYRERILAAVPADMTFRPLMTAYLTDDSNPDDLAAGFAEGVLTAAKLYPAGATTNSSSGVTDIRKIEPVLERMAAIGMPLCIHGEVTDPEVDVFDREAVFIDRIMAPLAKRLPELKIVFEHITTREAVQFVEGAGANLAATITPQHLHINRNAMLVGGIRPHFYCLPVAKRSVPPPLPAMPSFSSAPTAPRITGMQRNRVAAARAFSTRPSPSKAIWRSSRPEGRWTASKPSPASSGRVFTAFPSTQAQSRLSAQRSRFPPWSMGAKTPSSPSTRARGSTGGS